MTLFPGSAWERTAPEALPCLSRLETKEPAGRWVLRLVTGNQSTLLQGKI